MKLGWLGWGSIAVLVYLTIGYFVQARMFAYPVGTFWRIVVVVFWPIALFI